MASVAGRRIVFKNNTWFTLNADVISDAFPGCLLAVCERDPFFVAQSIWQQRLDLYSDQARWWSVRPENYLEIAKLDPLEQVAAQAVSIVKGLEASLARVESSTVIRVPYERLAKDPRGIVREIAIASGFGRDAIAKSIADLPGQMASTNQARLDASQAARLKAYVDEWVGR